MASGAHRHRPGRRPWPIKLEGGATHGDASGRGLELAAKRRHVLR